MDFMAWRRRARPRLRPERLDSHQPHQSLNPLAVDGQTLLAQHSGDAPRAQERALGVQRIDAGHQRQIVVIGWRRLAIDARTRHAQHLALPADR